MTAALERARGWILCLGLALFVPVGLLAKQSLATTFIATAVLVMLTAGVGRADRIRPATAPLAAFVVLCVYVAVTHLLVLDCVDCAARAAGKLPMIGLIVWILSSEAAAVSDAVRRRIGLGLVIGLAAAIAIAVADLSSDAAIYRFLSGRETDPDVPLFRYNRGTSALVLLMWPAAAWLWNIERRGPACALILASVGVALFGDSASASVAAGLGVVVFAVAWRAPRQVLMAGLAVTGAFALAAPTLFLFLLDWVGPIKDRIPPSTLDRIEIWHRAANAVADAPILGHGMGAIRELGLPADLAQRYVHLVKPPTHPHDAAIQIWLDLGAVGLLIAAVFTWLAIRPVRAYPNPWRAAGLAAAAGTTFTALVSYGLWQETWLAIIAMTLLAFRVLVPAPPSR